ADRPGSCADDPDRACPATCGSVVRTARRNADNAALCRQSSYDARAPRASFCEDDSQCVTSCDSDPIPASKLLVSQNRSDRGACGFVLTLNPEVTRKRKNGGYSRVAHNTPGTSYSARMLARSLSTRCKGSVVAGFRTRL